MSFISLVKSVTFYSGSIAVADGFVGDKDVTLNPAVDPTRVINVIPLRVNAASASGPFTFGRVTTGNMGYAHCYIASATAFRFKTVANGVGAGAQSIDYAFLIVESR
jgi:hypothetical protein